MNEHMKKVALRNFNKNEKMFFKTLRYRHWEDEDIKQMWKYVKRKMLKKQNNMI